MGGNNIDSRFINNFKAGLEKSGVDRNQIDKLKDDDFQSIFVNADKLDGQLDGKISDDAKKQIFETLNIDTSRAEDEFNDAFETYSNYQKVSGDSVRGSGDSVRGSGDSVRGSGDSIGGSTVRGSGDSVRGSSVRGSNDSIGGSSVRGSSVSGSNDSLRGSSNDSIRSGLTPEQREYLKNNPAETYKLNDQARLSQYEYEVKDNAYFQNSENLSAYKDMRNKADELDKQIAGDDPFGWKAAEKAAKQAEEDSKALQKSIDSETAKMQARRTISSHENDIIQTAMKNKLNYLPGNYGDISNVSSSKDKELLKEYLKMNKEDQARLSSAMAKIKNGKADSVIISDESNVHQNQERRIIIDGNDGGKRETLVAGAVEDNTKTTADNKTKANKTEQTNTTEQTKNKSKTDKSDNLNTSGEKTAEKSDKDPAIGSAAFKKLPKTKQIRMYNAALDELETKIKDLETKEPSKSDKDAHLKWEDEMSILKEDKSNYKKSVKNLKGGKSAWDYLGAAIGLASPFTSGDTKNVLSGFSQLFKIFK